MRITSSTLLAAAIILLISAPLSWGGGKPRVIDLKTLDLSAGHMALTSTRGTIEAGDVIFVAGNRTTKDRDHEVLLLKTDFYPADLPKSLDGLSIAEDKLQGVVELGEMKPGEGKTTKVTLEPGTYLLFCNLPGHAAAGMYTRLIVTAAPAIGAVAQAGPAVLVVRHMVHKTVRPVHVATLARAVRAPAKQPAKQTVAGLRVTYAGAKKAKGGHIFLATRKHPVIIAKK